MRSLEHSQTQLLKSVSSPAFGLNSSDSIHKTSLKATSRTSIHHQNENQFQLMVDRLYSLTIETNIIIII